jgi:hypothetical protein
MTTNWPKNPDIEAPKIAGPCPLGDDASRAKASKQRAPCSPLDIYAREILITLYFFFLRTIDWIWSGATPQGALDQIGSHPPALSLFLERIKGVWRCGWLNSFWSILLYKNARICKFYVEKKFVMMDPKYEIAPHLCKKPKHFLDDAISTIIAHKNQVHVV